MPDVNPIGKIFIYEISGECKQPGNEAGDNFMGCWREGGYSYLFYSRHNTVMIRNRGGRHG